MATPQQPSSYSPMGGEHNPEQSSNHNEIDSNSSGYSPAQQFSPQHPTTGLDRSNSVISEPENYYRPMQPQLSTDMNSHRNSAHTGPVSPISPADSQAPIIPPAAYVQNNGYRPPSTVNEYHQSPTNAVPGIQDYRSSVIQETVVYAPPPTIGVSNYRTSMGVVNGEIGSGMVVNSGLPVPITPLTPGLKTPTYKEEADVMRYEEEVNKWNKRDLAIKLKIRLAKVVLRTVNTACSLVVLALVASTVAIFNATKHLPARNNLPPWAVDGPIWPQIAIIAISSLSLALCLGILLGYWKGGHHKAEKTAKWWSMFGAASFIFAIVMWAIAAGIMQGSKHKFNGTDIWGWSCKDNNRRKLFEDDINFKLVCRQQDWVLVCAIIEIIIETLTIALHVFAFWRISTRLQLRKSMDVRDRARHDLWLTKLKEQQAAESGMQDPETSINTAYNQLNSNSAYPYVIAEEGHAVPIMQPPPPGHYATAGGAHGNGVPAVSVTPPGSGHPETVREFVFPPPGSRESQVHVQGPTVPATPRSVSFQATPGAPLPGQAQ
ncbi:hypothetical protein RUND412_007350 [Rhizina undulata]